MNDDGAPPAYPGEGPPAYPGEVPPPYPGSEEEPTTVAKAMAYAPPGYPGAPPAPPVAPALRPVGATEHDDLALQSGRKHLKAYQRGVDGAALSQLVMTLPTALISLVVVSLAFSLLSPVLGMVMTVVWLLSGPLVFHRPAEAAIAQHLLGMRRPTPAEAERLGAVWEEVTRRAGVSQGTYELWVQERAELNATAAAGHIVGVTRHALDRLSNARLAAVLAHELGHHVGGHTWAGMLADWYALPARTVWRWLLVGLLSLLRSKNKASMACGGCLSLLLLQFLYLLIFMESMWWLAVPFVAAPLLITWLHRRAEFRADDYAAGLGFGDELMEVLAAEHQAQTGPSGTPPSATPYGAPLPPGAAPGPAPYPAPYPGRKDASPLMVKAAHTNFEARLQHLQRNGAERHR
ncbi:M48 family metalloprotease [Streptomyces sp. NPDC026206]|uniref:M48 family metalloprotease n=1 Tax=Streptomyces sp. NPDC026206 TaxID=3157089 RepID=UPI0033D9613E